MARLYFHLCMRLSVQFLLTYVRALSKMVIVHNCLSTPAIYIHISERGTTLLFPPLWVKSCLQLSKCLENTCSSSSALCIAAVLNSDLEKTKYKLSIVQFILRKEWFSRMRSKEENLKYNLEVLSLLYVVETT